MLSRFFGQNTLSDALKKTIQTSKRTVSMQFNLFNNYLGWDSFNQISEGLFLGMIPTKEAWANRNFNNLDDQIIAFVNNKNPQRPLKLVVSVTEKDELEGNGFLGVTMVSPADWKKKGVNHHLLDMADFTASVPNKSAIDTVFKIRQIIASDGSVYIHCKAGRSRSIMISAIYLAIFGPDPLNPKYMDLDDATKFLQSKRYQMAFDPDKVVKASEIIAEIKAMMERQSPCHSTIPAFDASILNVIDEYLAEDKEADVERRLIPKL